ncbi:MAG: ABC transporter substrate-binding protein [Firmicutes bacterium]|nr:ABC transporter substrate-binding protein [Bacillota bacterium]
MLILLSVMAAGLGTHGVKTYFLYSKEPEKPDTMRVVETERSLLALPHYIALAQGFYQEQKLQVESFVSKEAVQEEVMLTDEGDVLLGNISQALFTRPLGTGADLVAFAGLGRKEGSFLLGREDTQAFSWEQVKKRSILGDAPDTQSNIVLEEALKQNKLALQHQVIIIQNLPPNLKEGAFQAGVGHFVQMSEPMATMTEQSGVGKTVVFLGSAVGPVPSLAFLAPESYLKEHSRECQKLVNGLCKGMLWLDYHSPAEAARVIAPYFPDLDRQTLTKIIERYKKLGLWDKNPVIGEEDYENLQSYVKRAGELTNPVEYKDGVYAKFARKAVRSVEYIPPEKQKEKTWWEKVKTLDFK